MNKEGQYEDQGGKPDYLDDGGKQQYQQDGGWPWKGVGGGDKSWG